MTRRSIKKLKVNDEAKYSITRPYEAKQIIRIMKKFIKKPLEKLVITDATSCVGGDLINFSQSFIFVNGVEINPSNYRLLLENTKGIGNISLINDNYLNVYDSLIQDVIYLDPPWGGPEYKNKKSIDLKLSGIKLNKIIHTLRGLSRYIFIKVPLNANLKDITGTRRIIYNKRKHPSFMLICINNI